MNIILDASETLSFRHKQYIVSVAAADESGVCSAPRRATAASPGHDGKQAASERLSNN